MVQKVKYEIIGGTFTEFKGPNDKYLRGNEKRFVINPD